MFYFKIISDIQKKNSTKKSCIHLGFLNVTILHSHSTIMKARKLPFTQHFLITNIIQSLFASCPTCVLFLYPNLGSHIACNCHIYSVSFHLERFLCCHDHDILKECWPAGQLYCKMFLNLGP